MCVCVHAYLRVVGRACRGIDKGKGRGGTHHSSSCESLIKFSTNFICIPGTGGTPLAAAAVAALPSATATGPCRTGALELDVRG